MSLLLKAPNAEDDLIKIWDWYADEVSEARADHILDSINDVCTLLATQPLMGKVLEGYKRRIRCFPFRSYTLFYSPFENGIELLRVLHHSQDIALAFRSSK